MAQNFHNKKYKIDTDIRNKSGKCHLPLSHIIITMRTRKRW